eukprot:7435692-Alexandrium_andersonii.AAC.1
MFLDAACNAVCRCQPEENVARLKTHDRGRTLKRIIDKLEAAGYHTSYRVYNTADFGLPQRRRRLYLVGVRDDVRDSAITLPRDPGGLPVLHLWPSMQSALAASEAP